MSSLLVTPSSFASSISFTFAATAPSPPPKRVPHGPVHRLASHGGAPITGSPCLRLRLALRPHDVLRLARPGLIGSPRTVGPQPHDVLRLARPGLIGSPRTVGPQPHDVLRLARPGLIGSPRTVGPQPHDVLRLARPGLIGS